MIMIRSEAMETRIYFVPNQQGGSWQCKILRDLGLDSSNYGDKIKGKLASLSKEELVELGKKYIPGQNAQGALTFLIHEMFRRILEGNSAPTK